MSLPKLPKLNLPKIVILWGLPGSGKTTFIPRLKQELEHLGNGNIKKSERKKVHVIDVDELRLHDQTVIQAVAAKWNDTSNGYARSIVIFDGVFVSNPVTDSLLTELLKGKNPADYEIMIYCWKPDRELCVHNDRGRSNYRQGRSAKLTIENIEYQEPSEELLKKWGIKTVTRKAITRKQDWKVWAEEMGLKLRTAERSDDPHNVKYLCSERWSMGGSGADYNGNSWKIEPETEKEFVELDELLSNYFADITFLQYKKLMSRCVQMGTEYESDYYGGGVNYGYHLCNVQELFAELVELNKIKLEDYQC